MPRKYLRDVSGQITETDVAASDLSNGTTGSGATVLATSPAISGGTINGAVIGGTSAAAGTFAALTANSSLAVSGTATVTNTANTTLTTLASINASAGNAAVCRSQWGTSALSASFVIDVFGTNFTGKGSVVEINNKANSNMRFLTNDTIAMDINGAQQVTYYGDLITSGSSLKLTSPGDGVYIKEGSNARMGTATLVAGTVTVSNTSVTANTRIFVSIDNAGTVANLGTIYEDSTVRSAGTSFTIKSTNILSNAVVSWLLVEPA